jgi:hypothetical protein
MDSYTKGDWRKVMAISSIPPLIAFIAIWMIMIDSPRLLLATGKFEKGIENLDYIG